MKSEKFMYYVYDLGILIKEKAKQAKLDKEASIGSLNLDYADGYLMALYEIVSLMQQQAEIFEIKKEDIGLADIDPDSELL